MDKVLMAIASGLGLGYLPIAPGTWGTLLAFPIQFLLVYLDLAPIPYALVLTGLFWLGVGAAGSAEKIMDRPDPGLVVIDEVVGMLIGLIAVPMTPLAWGLAFFVFRFFDIVKPFPIRLIDQRCHGGVGIMLDDVLAGVYTLATVHLAILLFPTITG
jgi:phosphatidylglycerophosphatase A